MVLIDLELLSQSTISTSKARIHIQTFSSDEDHTRRDQRSPYIECGRNIIDSQPRLTLENLEHFHDAELPLRVCARLWLSACVSSVHTTYLTADEGIRFIAPAKYGR